MMSTISYGCVMSVSQSCHQRECRNLPLPGSPPLSWFQGGSAEGVGLRSQPLSSLLHFGFAPVATILHHLLGLAPWCEVAGAGLHGRAAPLLLLVPAAHRARTVSAWLSPTSQLAPADSLQFPNEGLLEKMVLHFVVVVLPQPPADLPFQTPTPLPQDAHVAASCSALSLHTTFRFDASLLAPLRLNSLVAHRLESSLLVPSPSSFSFLDQFLLTASLAPLSLVRAVALSAIAVALSVWRCPVFWQRCNWMRQNG